MDPASIVGLVAACSSLTKQCASVVDTLHSLVETYKHAELAILSIAEECGTIQFAWRRIAEWANGNLHQVDDFEELGERLQRSIYCGELVMSALEAEIMAITSKTSSLMRRIGVVRNSSVFIEHQTRLRGQVTALQLLIQVLNLPYKQYRIDVLSVQEKIFFDADESAFSIVPSDRSTHYSIDGQRRGDKSNGGDIQYIRYSFENALFTSHVYKRNYGFRIKDDRALMRSEPSPRVEELTSSDSDEVASACKYQPQSRPVPAQKTILAWYFPDVNGRTTYPIPSNSRKTTRVMLGLSDNIDSDSDTSGVHVLVTRLSILQNTLDPWPQDTMSEALRHANAAVSFDHNDYSTRAIQSYAKAWKVLRRVTATRKDEGERQMLETILAHYRSRSFVMKRRGSSYEPESVRDYQ